ncbi:MAG: hypothetical protein HY741_25875 [Chloroflexi bacterium]|nr:hypothetical protein [Chloroflexota bacterium]
MNDVAALSPTDVWAVGGSLLAALSSHWDGTQWFDTLWNQESGLSGITALAQDDVWAVGYSGAYPIYQSLLVHWDGTQWREISTPHPANKSSALYDIAAVTPDDLWAVG